MFGKFIIIIALVITSVSVCFPSEIECVDLNCDTIELSSKAPLKTTEKSESHHCVCSMVCHNLFVNFTASTSASPSIISLKKSFYFTQKIYPLVVLSLDKPPIV